MGKKIVIHPNVDLDACVSVALAGADPQDVHFVGANITALPANCLCCGKPLTGEERILDHPLGEKGRLDPDGTRHSAAASMPEAKDADPNLIAEVDEEDATGVVRHPKFPLSSIVSALMIEGKNRGLTGTELDREVVAIMGRIVRGLNLYHKARESTKKFVASKVRIVKIGAWKLALFPKGNVPPQAGHVLNEEYGVSATLYQNGLSLGLVRFQGRTEPDFRRLEPHLPGWFVHTTGFMVCWGSKKAPVTTPPPQGTPQTPEELLALVQRVFA